MMDPTLLADVVLVLALTAHVRLAQGWWSRGFDSGYAVSEKLWRESVPKCSGCGEPAPLCCTCPWPRL